MSSVTLSLIRRFNGFFLREAIHAPIISIVLSTSDNEFQFFVQLSTPDLFSLSDAAAPPTFVTSFMVLEEILGRSVSSFEREMALIVLILFRRNESHCLSVVCEACLKREKEIVSIKTFE